MGNRQPGCFESHIVINGIWRYLSTVFDSASYDHDTVTGIPRWAPNERNAFKLPVGVELPALPFY